MRESPTNSCGHNPENAGSGTGSLAAAKKLATVGGLRPPVEAYDGAAAADVAPPWHYNPSSWRQRLPIAALGFVAACIAFYMAAYQWRFIQSAWDPVFGLQSQAVLDPDVLEAMRRWVLIPDAALGGAAYLSEAILALAGSTRRWRDRPWLVVLFGIDVIPLGLVSAILVVLQGAVVGSWCFLCLVTAVISLILVVAAYDEVWSSILLLRKKWRSTHSRSRLSNAFWGNEPSVNGTTVDEGIKVASWPRVAELLLGGWIVAGSILLPGADSSAWNRNALLCGLAIVVLAGISFWPRFRRAHLAEILVVLWLVGLTLGTLSHPASPAVQNALVTVFVLVNFAIIPGKTPRSVMA